MKEKESLKLIKMYLAYHFNKSFIILLSIILLFLIIVLINNIGLPIDEMEYFNNKSFYHVSYLEQSLYIINIINSVIIASLISNEINSLSQFDPMFVSYIKRSKIINAKIITNFILITIVLLYEMIILFLFGVIYYPDFIISTNILIIIPYQLLFLFELIIIGELLTLIINNFLVTIIIFLFSFILNILAKIENLKDYIYNIIPFIEIRSIDKILLNGNIYIYILVNMISYILIQIIYQKKDIC